MSLDELVNLKSYPIDTAEGREHVKTQFQKDFQEKGLTVLPDFLTQAALERCTNFSLQRKAQFFKQMVHGNAYLTEGSDELPKDHVLNAIDSTSLGILASDQIGSHSPLKKLYHSDEFLLTTAAILEKPELYRYECPLGDVNVAMMEEGDQLRWHFDLSDFVVSIPLQLPESGGVYEYIRNLRTSDNPNYDGVAKALRGENEQTQVLSATPGSLILFEGRYTMHRVTKVFGHVDRYVALFGFADRPGVTSSEYLRRIRYGRVG